MITMKDIADRCGVSVMTVSRVINGSGLVSGETRKLIMDTCKELGYIPNSAAKALVTKETNMIGLVVPDVNYYYANIIKSISAYSDACGYGLLLCSYDHKKEKELEYLYYLLQGRVDGIILFPIYPREDDYINIINKLPVVIANRTVSNLNTSYVGSDNYAGSVKIMEYLIEKGYKRIGAIHSDLSIESFGGRMRGYKDILAKYGISYDDSIVFDSRLLFNEGYDYAKHMISANVDAVFAFNDVCALGVMKYCADNDISVPGDIGVAGFDNIQYLELFDHKLTTVDYNGILLGEQAAVVVIDEIRNPHLPKRSIILDPKLISGKTV